MPTPNRPRPTPGKPELAPEVERETTPRLSLTLTPNGSAIDWTRLRGSTREQLDRLMHESGWKSPDDLRATAASEPAPEIFTASWCGTIYDVLAQLLQSAAMRTTGCTRDQAKVLAFDALEKDALIAPTIRILNKYAGSMFLKYGDEAALASQLVLLVAAKFQLLRADMREHPSTRPQAIPFKRADNEPPPTDIGADETGPDGFKVQPPGSTNAPRLSID